MLREGRSFFATRPDPERRSYFETPAGSERGDNRCIGPYLQAENVVRHILSIWLDQGHGWLQGFGETLKDLQHSVLSDKGDSMEEKEEVSDFVYPLF